MTLAELLAHWRSKANDLERYAPAVAHAFNDAADQLEDALQSAEESVTLREAADLGGYSVDSLQHMVASGRIANVGRKGKPRLRRIDVPVKPGHVALTVSNRQLCSRSAVVASVREIR